MMKTKKDLEYLKKHLEDRKPFKIIYDGIDFGTYYYDNNEFYVSEEFYGKINIKGMLQAIVDENYFIKLEIV